MHEPAASPGPRPFRYHLKFMVAARRVGGRYAGDEERRLP